MKLKRRDIEKRLDKMCSVVVRFGAPKFECYTCGKKILPEEAHCAHFVGRSCRTLRWDKSNMRMCCNYCNTFLNGNLARYYKHLLADGEDPDALLAIEDAWKRGETKPYRIMELQERHDVWLWRVRELEKKLHERFIPKSWDYFEQDPDILEASANY